MCPTTLRTPTPCLIRQGLCSMAGPCQGQYIRAGQCQGLCSMAGGMARQQMHHRSQWRRLNKQMQRPAKAPPDQSLLPTKQRCRLHCQAQQHLTMLFSPMFAQLQGAAAAVNSLPVSSRLRLCLMVCLYLLSLHTSSVAATATEHLLLHG